MNISFIAHAGLIVSEGDSCVAIDPWFFSSGFESPVLQGLSPYQRTIDFQTYPAIDDISQFRPGAILCSHLHTHHSPINEIQILVSQSPESNVTIAVPPLRTGEQKRIEQNLGSVLPKCTVRELQPESVFRVGDLEIEAIETAFPNHLGWFISSKQGSLLHIADAPINSNFLSSEIGECWASIKGRRPDLLFLSAGGTSTRSLRDGQRVILENGTMSPIEAARLTQWVKPQMACPIGFYNHSIWCNRQEMTAPAHFVEDQFRWAVSYLDPEISAVALRPGTIFELSKIDLERPAKISFLRRP